MEAHSRKTADESWGTAKKVGKDWLKWKELSVVLHVSWAPKGKDDDDVHLSIYN